jgi:hypothetical protein
MKEKRSLYCCLQAKVKEDRIVCAEGHPLSRMGGGTIPVVRLVRGTPLELTVCQGCKDFRSMGPPIPKEERGWVATELPGIGGMERQPQPTKDEVKRFMDETKVKQ